MIIVGVYEHSVECTRLILLINTGTDTHVAAADEFENQ